MALLIKRLTILVADLDRSLQLYSGILRLSVDFIKPSRPDTPAYNYFNVDKASNTITQFAALSAGNQARCFGIIEVKGAPLQRGGTVRTSAVVVHVASCEELSEVLKSRGYEVFDIEPAMATPEGDMYTEMAFVDCDNNLVVAYHLRKPDEASTGQ